MAVRGRNGHHIQTAFHQAADVSQNAFAIQFAEGVARRGDGGADR